MPADRTNARQLTQFVFTINNPHEDCAHELIDTKPEWVKYVVFQLEEAPSTGTKHLQGYAELTERKTLTTIKGWLGNSAHIEKRMGTRQQARDYCMKEDTRLEGPWEAGVWDSAGQGRRSDLDAAAEVIRTRGLVAVREEMPGTYIRYANMLSRYAREIEVVPRDQEFVPREWQSQVLDLLADEPDDRTIYWITDTTGNTGKSRLTKHLVREKGAICLSGPVGDMRFGYMQAGYPRIVVFDVTRTQADNIKHLYAFAEQLKNGMFFNTKYESRMCCFEAPHVVFMANVSWDRQAISNDRMHEINLSEVGQAGVLPSWI